METLYQIIAKNVLVLRKEVNLSQLALATSAEIALKTLHAIEHTHANCRLSTDVYKRQPEARRRPNYRYG